MPEGAAGYVLPGLSKSLSDDAGFWTNNLPSLPTISISSLASGTAVTSYSGSALYQMMGGAINHEEPIVFEWAQKGIVSYEVIQEQ